MTRVRISTTVDRVLLDDVRRLHGWKLCEPPEIGRRPVVVLSRDAAIPRLDEAIGRHPHLNVVELTTRDETRRFVRAATGRNSS